MSEALRKSGEDASLIKKAASFLAKRSYSTEELRKKLARYDVNASVEAVLARLEQLNLLNDCEYAYNFALCRIKQHGWSSRKIEYALIEKGVSSSIAESALERAHAELGEDVILHAEIKKYCAQKGVPPDSKSFGKLRSRLLQRGFEDDNIVNAMHALFPDVIETGE
jgi:SOS response regulatory protein OraA/RecX